MLDLLVTELLHRLAEGFADEGAENAAPGREHMEDGDEEGEEAEEGGEFGELGGLVKIVLGADVVFGRCWIRGGGGEESGGGFLFAVFGERARSGGGKGFLLGLGVCGVEDGAFSGLVEAGWVAGELEDCHEIYVGFVAEGYKGPEPEGL